jgi:hypothetical protein
MIALHVLDVLERTKGDSKTAVITPIWHFYDTQACLAYTTGGNMIRSLIYQLLRRYDDLFEYILPEFEIQREDLLHDSMFETQWSIFESMVYHATLPIHTNTYLWKIIGRIVKEVLPDMLNLGSSESNLTWR